jgi:uncharacterized protein (UPF0335 family)
MSNILAHLQDIENREELISELTLKRDNLLQELQNANINLPTIIEENKLSLTFKKKNESFLSVFNQELERIEQEQTSLIHNIKSIYKDQLDTLINTDHYKTIKKRMQLSKEELINLIYDDIIESKMSEVEFVN